MKLLAVLGFLVTLIGTKRVLSATVTDDSGRTPRHSRIEDSVRQESRLKYEPINRPSDLKERPDLSTLLDVADRILPDCDTFLSRIQKNVPMGKNAEDELLNGVPNDNDRTGNYDRSEGLEWASNSFNTKLDPIQSSEEDEPGREDLKSLYDMNEIVLGDIMEDNLDQNSESHMNYQNAEGPEDNRDNNVSNMQQITSKLVTLGAEQLYIDSDIIRDHSASSGAPFHGDEELTSAYKSNIARKQIDNALMRHRHRRSNVDATNSTPVDIDNLFKGGDVGGVELTQLAEGGGLALTSAVRLSTISPYPSPSVTNATLEKEKQSTTHSVEGGVMPLNESQKSSISRHATNITTTTISQEHISQMGPDKEPTNIANSDTKSHKTVPRKGAEAGTVVGRKGVHDLSVDDASLTLASVNKSSSQDFQSISSNASQPIDGKGDVIESNPPLKKKPRPKPLTLTDKTSFNSTTVPPHLSSQRDYVVPIVILIFAVPLFAILGTILYKKGSEYWSRRHYRRMDFLIDGMYHD